MAWFFVICEQKVKIIEQKVFLSSMTTHRLEHITSDHVSCPENS